jgi:hypothetical protein
MSGGSAVDTSWGASMTRGKLHSVGIATAVAIALAGWWAPAWAHEEGPQTLDVDPAAFSAIAPYSMPLVSSDDLLAGKLAEQGIDWFAGLYEDHGSTVVLTTRTGVTRHQLTRAVRALVETGIVSGADTFRSVRLLPAKYAFGVLNEWKKSLEDGFFALDGAVLTDLDEKADRIVLGYDASSVPKRAVKALVQRSGVPLAAVEIRSVAPIVEESLRDRFQFKVGGLQVHNPQANVLCTLGFTAYRPGTGAGFVTNDHCTRTTGVVDGDEFYQPSNFDPAWFVGHEAVDRPLSTGGTCPAGRECRYSDAAFIVSGPGSVTLGSAAVPQELGDPFAWDGSLTTITASGSAVIGTPVFKVGRTTGKTEGTVAATCVNTSVAGKPVLLRLCQDRADYARASGDSGSPVLAPNDNPIGNASSIYGVHWGSSGHYSRTTYITAELGPLLFEAF